MEVKNEELKVKNVEEVHLGSVASVLTDQANRQRETLDVTYNPENPKNHIILVKDR